MGKYISKPFDGFKRYCVGNVFRQLRDFAVQAGTLNGAPINISQAAHCHLQCVIFGRKLQIHHIGSGKGEIIMVCSQPQVDCIGRLDRLIQRDFRRRLQVGVLYYIATQAGDSTGNIYAAFAHACHFPDLLKVQKLKCRI